MSSSNNSNHNTFHPLSASGSRKREVTADMALTNKELSECDREKLHLLGHIQGCAGNALFISYPEGKIIAADAQVRSIPWIEDAKNRDLAAAPRSPRSVRRTSANSSDSGSSSGSGDEQAAEGIQEMLGTPLASWIPSQLHEELWDAINGLIEAKSRRVFHFFSHRSSSYAITIHTTANDYTSLGIEIELVDSTESSADFYNSLISLGRIMEFHGDEKVLKTACDAVFKILGNFDRGLVYKFLDDNSGEVVYETKKETCRASSYLGMRFPATDIPLPARQLYIKNGLRYIQDVYAEDTPILHKDGAGSTVDLSHCRMRAVSKPHIMYLRNMGIDASMSIAIVVDNRLWGLLAFHGYSGPTKPSLHQRIACETISSMLSVKMEALMKKAQSVRVIELSETLMRWQKEFCVASNLKKYGQDILNVLDADVLVARIQDPAQEEMETVVVGDQTLVPQSKFWTAFEQTPNRKLSSFTTRQQIEQLGLTATDCPAAGVVYFKDALVQVMVGRGLRSKDVVWGGKPDEPKMRINGFLSPRKSFEKYMETARKEARSWSKTDLHVISAFMDRVIESSTMRMMAHLKRDIEEANLKYLDAYERIRDNSSWFAHMSHEIRTPFHGVMGCLNILQESGYDMPKEEIQDMVETALVSGNHMIKLLNDILDIAKNKYLSHAIDNVRINYKTLASEATQGLKSLAHSNGIGFNSDVLPLQDNSVITTDKTKVVQIVSNLLNNAIKFSAGGSVAVKFQLLDTRCESINEWSKDAASYAGTIFTTQEHELFTSTEAVKAKIWDRPALEKQQKWLLVSVSDSGCGMKPEELADMLRPYTQSSSGSNKTFQGTGLGLFICTSLCRQLRGFLACSSTPTKGTVFHVGIPVGISKDQSCAAQAHATQNDTSTGWPDQEIQLSGPIAVCDDNKINVKILKRTLVQELKKRKLDEVEIIAAHGGEEIVELYKAKRPRLLFIDYHMPEVDGVEATEQIRRYETENGLKPSYILSYTADATDDAEQNILSRGTNEIMTKPPPKGFMTSFVNRLRVVPSDAV